MPLTYLFLSRRELQTVLFGLASSARLRTEFAEGYIFSRFPASPFIAYIEPRAPSRVDDEGFLTVLRMGPGILSPSRAAAGECFL